MDWLFYIPHWVFWTVAPAVVGFPTMVFITIFRIKSGQRLQFLRENASMLWLAAAWAMLLAILVTLLISAFTMFIWTLVSNVTLTRENRFTILGAVYVVAAIAIFSAQLRGCTNDYRGSHDIDT